MSCITIIKEIKNVHPEEVVLAKVGSFYKVYGKDAYIISKNLQYKIKEETGILSCGFPTKSINKVIAKLEKKKINYIIIESRDNYNINEHMDFKNLNNYSKEYQKAKIYVNNQIRIERIYEYLNKNSTKEELKNILKEIEETIYAKGKI